jgi:hypothetical protein
VACHKIKRLSENPQKKIKVNLILFFLGFDLRRTKAEKSIESMAAINEISSKRSLNEIMIAVVE